MTSSFVMRISCLALASLSTLSIAPAFAEEKIIPADAFITLGLKQNYCITVNLFPPNTNGVYGQFLLGANGENLRDYSYKQIKEKLSGPQGTTVNLELGFPNGSTETVAIERQLVNYRYKQNSKKFEPILEIDSKLNQFREARGFSNIWENSYAHSDLIVKGACMMSERDKLRKVGTVNRFRVLLNCMLLCQAIGDFDSADQYLEKLLKETEKKEKVSINFHRIKPAIQNLVALGKIEEAEKLCQYLLKKKSQKHCSDHDAISIIDAYFLVPTDSAKLNCRKLALTVVDNNLSKPTFSFDQNEFWLCQYLESIGQKQKALSYYSKLQESLKKHVEKYTGITSPQMLAFCLYSEAYLVQELGNKVKAKAYLDEIKALYKSLSAKQQNILNKIPEFFPNPDDVTAAEKALQDSRKIEAPPRVAKYPYEQELDLYGQKPSLKLALPEARECFKLIKSNKKAEAIDVASKLVKAYNEKIPKRKFALVRQNLFCTILRIARAFADQGWYQSSDKLLAELKQAAEKRTLEIPKDDVAWLMINAEQVCNEVLSGKKANWSLVAKADSTLYISPLSPASRLAKLALAYSLASDSKRAKIFMDQSLYELKGELTKSTKGHNTAGEILLLAAEINARDSKIAIAQDYLNIALKETFELNERAKNSLLATADLLDKNGKTKQAIVFLQIAQGKIPSHMRRTSGNAINLKLAALYSKINEPDKALTIIKNEQRKSSSITTRETNLLAAKSCEKKKDYVGAAKYYCKAGRRSNGCSEKTREKSLRRAIACLKKLAEPIEYSQHRKLLADCYLELAPIVGSNDRFQELNLMLKAVNLIDDKDKDKANHLSIIGFMYEELAVKVEDKKSQEYKHYQMSSIDYRRKAAELETLNETNKASDRWLRLALAEAQANLVDAAIKHARKGISAYKLSNAQRHSAYQLVNGNLPSALVKAGAPDKAELVMKEAQARVESVAGPGSLQAQTQLGHWFAYLVQQKKYNKADKILDKLLSTHLDRGKYTPPYISRYGCSWTVGPRPVRSTMEVVRNLFYSTRALSRRGEYDQSLRFLNKILNAEIRQFGKSDYRVALTYVELGNTHYAAGNFQEAHDAYKSAIEIKHKHESLRYALLKVSSKYYEVLRKLGKKSEIEKLEQQKLDEEKSRQERRLRKRGLVVPGRK